MACQHALVDLDAGRPEPFRALWSHAADVVIMGASGGYERGRLIPVPGRQDDLGVAAGQFQPGLADVIVAPPQPVSEGIAVEAQARVKIWHRDGDRVDHLEQESRRWLASLDRYGMLEVVSLRMEDSACRISP